MATSLVPESAFKASSAAPLPRPPQPTRPILMVLLPRGMDHRHGQAGSGYGGCGRQGGGRARQEFAPLAG